VKEKKRGVFCGGVAVGVVVVGVDRLYAALETLDARLEALDDLADAAHLVELDLQLVDLAQEGAEARNLSVGIAEGVAGAVGLQRRGRLGLLGELHGRGGQRQRQRQGANAARATSSRRARWGEGGRRATGDGRRATGDVRSASAAGSSTSGGQSGR
jgi:hypothetical protein